MGSMLLPVRQSLICVNTVTGAAAHNGRTGTSNKGIAMRTRSEAHGTYRPAGRDAARRAITGALALVLAGCAVEVQNTQPLQTLQQQTQPAGSVYTGWRVFQDKCAACHGPAATGTAGAPDLLPAVRTMGPRAFVTLVLNRYDWGTQLDASKTSGAARDALVDDLVQRRAYVLTMPAWQSEPRVNAHIADLYAYLSARAQGAQGPERPTP